MQHIAQIIRPALDEGRTVLTDRFVGSTLAYQGAGRGIAVELIRTLHAGLCGGLWPDLTIVLDIEARVGLGRSLRRLAQDGSGETRFEQLDLDFHERVRQGFLNLSATGNVVIVDAAGAPEAVQQAIRAAVATLLTRE